MPRTLLIPEADIREETRLLATAVADLHYALGTVVEHGEYLVPGEAVGELRTAWASAEQSFEALVRALLMAGSHTVSPATPTTPGSISVDYESLSANQLVGPVGRVKLSHLGRLKNLFSRCWNTLPRTTDTQQKASEAAADYLEFGATIVSSIPGYDQAEEFLLVVKQLLAMRAKRGDRVDA